MKSVAGYRLSVAGIALAAAPAVYACEPILPFMQVVGGPALLTHSWIVLGAAVLGKSLLFAVLEKRLPAAKAVLLMVAGNVLTTFVGLLAAAMIGSGGTWLFGLPIVWALCWLPCRRAVAVSSRRWISRMPASLLSFAMTAAFALSCFLFIAARGAIVADQLALYWTIKLIAIYLALLPSILLSAFWEEWVIWRSLRLPAEVTFTAPVLRANLYVLLVVMLFAAGVMLPKRLMSPDFLVRLGRPAGGLASR